MTSSSMPIAACRMEMFSKKNVTVFQENFESLHFARQVATVKNIQADSRPFYVMNVGRVNEILDVWGKFLPRVRPFYAVNCNENDVLLKVLADNPLIGFQCNTRQNMEKVLEHADPERVLYSNACWTRSTLSNAAARQIRRLSFESARDLTRLVAANAGNAFEPILNVCVSADAPLEEDVEASMGCALADAPELIQLAADLGVPCVGVAFNVGTAADGAVFARYERALESMSRLFAYAYQIGSPLRLLNIGGDFVNENVLTESVSFSETCAQLNKSLNYYFPAGRYPQLEIIATPGRFIAESVFTLMTNVVGRRSVDASFVTNDDFDIGSEAFIYETNEGYYGSFGCTINANCNPQCAPLFDNYLDHYTSEHVYGSVMGPTLDERFDVLQATCRFRPLRVGEWLMWSNMGAYTLNNRADLEDDDASATDDAPAIFYFASQSDWDRLHGRQGVEGEMRREKAKMFYDDFEEDEGIRSVSPTASLASASDIEERKAESMSQTGPLIISEGEVLEDEDFLIGLDEFFDGQTPFGCGAHENDN